MGLCPALLVGMLLSAQAVLLAWTSYLNPWDIEQNCLRLVWAGLGCGAKLPSITIPVMALSPLFVARDSYKVDEKKENKLK